MELTQQRKTINAIFDDIGIKHPKRPTHYLASATVNTYEEYRRIIDQLCESFGTKPLYFRGQEQYSFPTPSIARGKKGRTSYLHYINNLVHREGDLVQEFASQCRQGFQKCFSEDKLSFLAICQHYGMPTRLLDVTSDEDIALYFATAIQNATTGCVYIFLPNNYSEDCDLITFFLHQPMLMRDDNAIGFSDMIKSYSELCTDYVTDADRFIKKVISHYESKMWLHVNIEESLSNQVDERIKNQKASFMVVGNALWNHETYKRPLTNYGVENAKEPMFIRNRLNRTNEKSIIKLLIPKECKTDMHRKLLEKGIDQHLIYPSFESYTRSYVEKYMVEHEI